MPYLKAGCCGCTLKRSATIVAWILLVLSVLQFVLAQVYYYFILTSHTYVYEPPLDVFTIAITSIVVNSLLLFGLKHDKRVYFWPWIVTTALFLIAFVGVINLILFAAIYLAKPFLLIPLLVSLLVAALVGYMFTLVVSQYQLLRDQFKDEPFHV